MKQRFFALSFDDGTPNDERLVSLLNHYGIKASFHLNANMIPLDGQIGPHDRLPLNRLQNLYTSHEVAAHGYTHPDLTKLKENEIRDELEKDIQGLNAYFHQNTLGFAYPYGTFNPTVIDVLKKTPLVYARTIRNTHRFDLPNDPLVLDPTCHIKDERLLGLTEAFIEKNNEPRFFLVWGHSYELENEADWERFEIFLKRIARKDDIFYGSILDCLGAMKQF
jgi:peptidoglycan/xylan/chitin deacetylase (PgdA/CDA1 family)